MRRDNLKLSGHSESITELRQRITSLLTDIQVHKPRIERPVRPQSVSKRRRLLPDVVGMLLAIAAARIGR